MSEVLPAPAARAQAVSAPRRFTAFLDRLIGEDPVRRAAVKGLLVRALVVLNVVLGTRYMLWRAEYTVNWALWPLGLSLFLAELFSYADSLLFCVTIWRVRDRGEPPVPEADLTVDVFVTTVNEPIELVVETAAAARDIHYPHQTWILDDGDRSEMREAAERIGVGYLTRHPHWEGKRRHAKAGNLISAMYQTTGEFLLVLDADQIPKPEILDRTLGYFRDPNLAFVQTPQRFRNTPPGDPFGSEAPLFYGPILQGKDHWNSAYFCGSNAVLRREALMQIGVVWYARDLHRRVRRALRAAIPRLRLARRRFRHDARVVRAIGELLGPVRDARRSLRHGLSLQTITWNFQRAVEQISHRMVEDDLSGIRAELPGPIEPEIRSLARREQSPLAAIAPVRDLLLGLDLDRAEEAEPVLPMSTVSVTEDMATALRIHGLGWRSAYHNEVLALGLGPEDLHTAMKQRLRWAQGTLQVLLRENPLVQPGLTVAQRLLYLGTMWSYLSGFVMIAYLLSPALYLCFGLLPVRANALEFLGYLAPVILVNYALFLVVGCGLPTWRGQQYSLALFPLWIRAVFSTLGNVWFGRELGFVVTSKTRQAGNHWWLIWPQAGVMALLAASIAMGLGRLALGFATSPTAILVNSGWALYSLVMLSVVLVAVAYRPPDSG